MPTSAEPWQPILDALTQVHADWPASDWSWDHRFKCVTSAIGADGLAKARSLLDVATPAEWTSISFSSAPAEVQALEGRCGDLRAGQLLLTGVPVSGMILFAMWWPWGDGSKVSVRLGIANSDRSTDLYPLVRTLFGIA